MVYVSFNGLYGLIIYGLGLDPIGSNGLWLWLGPNWFQWTMALAWTQLVPMDNGFGFDPVGSNGLWPWFGLN